MQRREFMKLLGATALSLTTPAMFGVPRAHAASVRYEGAFLLTVQAIGGWDQTMLLDPKLADGGVEIGYQEPVQVGGLKCAPTSCAMGGVKLLTVPEFVTALGSRFVAINGVDTQTNSHSTGMMHVWSGKSFQNLPAMGAVFAAAKLGADRVPMPYMATQGYQAVGNLVQSTRAYPASGLRALRDPNVLSTGVNYHSEDTLERIRLAQQKRDRSVTARTSMSGQALELQAAREPMDALSTFLGQLPATLVTVPSAFPALGAFSDPQLTGYFQSVQVALNAFAAGAAVTANIGVTGFDTHADHEGQHPAAMGKLLLTLQYAMRLADELNITDRLFVVVGSDFARTPTYNERRGKDHWNVTSMLVSGPGIRGGRAIGGTDEDLRALKLQPDQLDKPLAYDAKQGTRIYPAHVHRALRVAAGIDASDVVKSYPLPVDVALDDMLA